MSSHPASAEMVSYLPHALIAFAFLTVVLQLSHLLEKKSFIVAFTVCWFAVAAAADMESGLEDSRGADAAAAMGFLWLALVESWRAGVPG